MNAFRSFLNGLSRRAMWAFGIGLLAILVATGAIMWWALRPDYTLLVGNLKPTDASEITSALSGWGIPYRFGNGDQSVLVPNDEVYTTRMKLAAQGIPKDGDIGFEAFKSSGYGVTEFAQQVNYQLALQGELERTIDSMQEIDSARVHLTIQHSQLFQKNQEPSKASVTLHLRPGYQLSATQVAGVQRLVASAVEGLEPGSVAVLNKDGIVLSTSGVGATNLPERGAEEAKLEETIHAQIASLLFGVLHRHDSTISVAVQLNYDKIKRVQQRLLAQGKSGNGLLVHERTASTPTPASSSAAGQRGGAVTSQDLEYAHGTLQEEVDEAPGRIQRISVGVVIPGALSDTEIRTLSRVISAGVGLDASRGDRIDIAAIAPATKSEPLVTTAAVLTPGSARQVVAKPEAHASFVAFLRAWSKPALVFVAAVVVLLVLLVWQAIGSRRHVEPRRLTKVEREAALKRLVQWIEQPERVL